MNKKCFEVRDLRHKEKFVVDDIYLNGYGKIFGPLVSAIYLSLCRHANKEQKSWPNEATLAEEWCISERSARTAIKVLKEANLIYIERVRTSDGKWLNNRYVLMDKSVWFKPEAIQFRWSTGSRMLKPEAIKRKTTGSVVPIKETQLRKHKEGEFLDFHEVAKERLRELERHG